VFLAGRTLEKVERVARDIRAAGGRAEAARVDALGDDAEREVTAHAAAAAARAGGIDIAVNAVGIAHDQGTTFPELTFEQFADPVAAYTRTNFLTARAVAPYMLKRGKGVIITLSTPGARLSGQGFLGNGVASAAVEALSRILAGELGPGGVRVVCLRPDAVPEALSTSHTGQVFRRVAERTGTTVEGMLARRAEAETLLKRLPTLDEIADTVVFVASDRASAITGAIVNLTCGSIVD
jgi:NAD(P)-dependent dehydrogenase (short-subunit alcohol dehydrogenase family)